MSRNLSLQENNLPLPNARGGLRGWVDSANAESNAKNSSLRDSAFNAESWQSKKNNPCDSTESRPLRGAKNREQGCSSATADFLLEADKRGSPPKSEKRELLARRGSGAGGAALLREKTSDSNPKNGEKIADSAFQIKNAESTTKNASRGSILDEKSGLRSHERENRTNGSLTKRVASLPDLSPKDNAHLEQPND
ncbi:hypothetical protein [Helicobacter sp. 23-1045]